ncbi:hypothetical protein BBJ28_00004201 [Nothophytophthora sp. Chile5]|nr:hypothetical protein BBJ28_00004201 [Nothophytophthora sp. Chile5]
MAHASATRKVRLSDPHAELPIKNHKCVKNCTELYLANKRIEQIANFDTFVNLEVLWINGNQVPHENPKSHVVSCSSLEGSSLLHFKFLQELRLYDNKLKDLQGTLDVLSRLPHLQDLDLFGNAVVEEENYRLQVIRAIPSLHVLDRHVITDQERLKASRVLGSGVSKETLALVFRYLRARGLAVFCAGLPLEESADAQIPFEKLLPQSDSVHSKFHELKAESAQSDEALASKYKIRQKVRELMTILASKYRPWP